MSVVDIAFGTVREDCSEEGTWAGNIYTYLVVVLLQSGLFLLGRRVFVWAMGETTTAEMIGVGVNIGFVMLLMVKLLATAFLRVNLSTRISASLSVPQASFSPRRVRI